jgi:mRNA interferase MazF
MSGMSCRPGDLVGIPFPYSNLKAEKRRPVLVITHQDRHGDFICAAATSVSTAECAVFIDNASMKKGHLPRQSWIRCDKLFTLSKSVIVRQYGSLDNKTFNSVQEKICAYLGCKLN